MAETALYAASAFGERYSSPPNRLEVGIPHSGALKLNLFVLARDANSRGVPSPDLMVLYVNKDQRRLRTPLSPGLIGQNPKSSWSFDLRRLVVRRLDRRPESTVCLLPFLQRGYERTNTSLGPLPWILPMASAPSVRRLFRRSSAHMQTGA